MLKLINARINSSISEFSSQSAFHTIFNKYKIKFNGKPLDVFRYIIHRSFQRPRDIIQFCIKIQEECKSSNSLNYRTIHNAEKEYSLWLLSEVENEIAPIIKDTESLYEMLRLFGQKVYTVNKFREIYKNYTSKFPEIDAEKMLRILYDFGIISNVSLVDGKMDKDKFKTCFSSQRAMVERAYPGAFDFLDNGWDFLIMMTGLFALYFLVLRNKIEGMLPKVGTEDFDFGGQIKQLGKNIWSIPNQIAKAVGKAMDEKVI